MFPEWNPYLQRIKADDHQRRLRHLDRLPGRHDTPATRTRRPR